MSHALTRNAMRVNRWIAGVGGLPVFSPDNRWMAFTKKAVLPAKARELSPMERQLEQRFRWLVPGVHRQRERSPVSAVDAQAAERRHAQSGRTDHDRREKHSRRRLQVAEPGHAPRSRCLGE